MRAVVLLAIAGAALVLPGSGAPRGEQDGGTLRVLAPTGGGVFSGVDPGQNGNVVDLLRPTCESPLAYPDKALPAGLRLAPGLATAHPTVSRNGNVYRLTVRKDARFSTGTAVTAQDLARSLERVLAPEMQSGVAGFFEDVVGAKQMLTGRATSLRGAIARGRTLTLRLVRPVPDFASRLTHLCVVPASLPVDPEGAKAPIPSPAPYFVAEFVPGARLVLRRNRFYRGSRPHHVDQIVVDLAADESTSIDQVASGKADYVWPESIALNTELSDLARRYGVNRSRFFVRPSLAGRMFFLNTSRPLFRKNVKLRQALNFAVDRNALVREFGPYAATTTDQFLPPLMPGFRSARIYPVDKPDLRRARALAAGRTRGGKAVLYVRSSPLDVAAAQILQRNLDAIGIDVEVRQFPTPILFQKAVAPGEPFDILLVGWQAGYSDPGEMLRLFDGRVVNYSRFNSPYFNRLLDRAARLSGPDRYREYGRLDIKLARDAAPAIPYAVFNDWAFVSRRVGCVVLNTRLDLTAVCLK
jgi:peptide/nickel transport system substrate-binding protein